MLSQEIPDDWDAKPVKVLVGKNFDEVVKDKAKAAMATFLGTFGGSQDAFPIIHK